MEKSKLKDYLRRAFELEKNKYELERTLANVKKQEYKAQLDYEDNSTIKNKGEFGCGFAIAGFVIGLIVLGASMSFVAFIITNIIIWLIGYVIDKNIVDNEKSEQYSKNQNIKNENSRRIETAQKQNLIVKNSADKLSSAVEKTERELEILYAENFIYPKYRNIVAVSSIYEYLDSGRCNQLEGADGAYNLFELEVRLDKIITKMDIIISRLEQIMTSQFYLYTAIKDLNTKIDDVSSNIIKSTEKLDEIAVNSKITAYTTQVIERNQYYGRNWENGRGLNDHVNMPKL